MFRTAFYFHSFNISQQLSIEGPFRLGNEIHSLLVFEDYCPIWYIVSYGRRDFETSGKLEKELHKRLDMVIIENLSYERVIEKYDTKSNFFYCDPPYMLGYTYDNSKQFSHETLRDILKGIKGRFILSYDDNPEVLKLYKSFDLKHVTRTKGINRKEGKSEFNEVIIANFDLVESEQENTKIKTKTSKDIRGLS